MNPYLRNLMILTLVGTVNFFIFMFLSGRTALFLGRLLTPSKTLSNSRPILDVSDIRKHDTREFVRNVAHKQGQPPPNLNQPTKRNSSVFESEVSSASLTKGSVVKPTLHQNKVSLQTDPVAKQVTEHRTSVQTAISHAHNVLALYKRNDLRHINPHSYNLILDEPQACFDASGSPKNIFLLVLIATIHKNFEQRRAIRQTWGSPREAAGRKVITLFMLAKNEDAALQRQVEEECNEHHDLLLEDFKDTYKNLTLKTIMGMKWVYSHCPHAAYVMKTDDDMYVSYTNLIKHLSLSKTPSTNYAAGFLINGGPIRDIKSKWYMPKELYPEKKYPPFLSGTGYVMSGDVTGKIYEKSLDTKYLHLEDVFVAVCLKALHIVPVKNKDFRNWRTPYSYCRYRKLITTHMVQPSEMHRIWNDQQRPRSVVC